MENILTDTRQLERDNNLLKTELENRIEDLAKQNKAGGDNKVRHLQSAMAKFVSVPIISKR